MPKRSFEEWVVGIFDHPVSSKQWYWQDDADDCIEDPTTNAEYVYRLFTDCESIFKSYDDDQVGQGLWMMSSSACSDHMRSLVYEPVPPGLRWKAIRSIVRLNQDCFAKRCRNELLSGPEANQLEMICYMWWDNFPAWFDPSVASEAKEAREYIRVMKDCLAINHEGCQEGALHGLGHWVDSFPNLIGPVIDEFIASASMQSLELIAYAKAARTGMIQ